MDKADCKAPQHPVSVTSQQVCPTACVRGGGVRTVRNAPKTRSKLPYTSQKTTKNTNKKAQVNVPSWISSTSRAVRIASRYLQVKAKPTTSARHQFGFTRVTRVQAGKHTLRGDMDAEMKPRKAKNGRKRARKSQSHGKVKVWMERLLDGVEGLNRITRTNQHPL